MISINYNYCQNEIYAICINSDFIQSVVFKITNKNNKQNMNQKLMYGFLTILKKRFFLIDKKIVKLINSINLKENFKF